MRNQQLISYIASELGYRTDASETVFLEREITQLRAKVFSIDYPQLVGRNFAPLATDIAASASIYAYKVRDRIGRARISSDGSGDAPRIDLSAAEVTGKVRVITDSYGWTKWELREAARLQMSLSAEKGSAASEAIETSVDEMLAFGDLADSTLQDNVSTQGLLNNDYVAAQGIIDPGIGSWAGASSDNLLNALNAMVNVVVNESKQMYLPDTLVLSQHQYSIIATKQFSANMPDTVLQVFLRNNPYIKSVYQWHRCAGVGAGGKDRAVVYLRSPNVLEAIIPQPFEQEPPQASKFEMVVYCSARCGGVKWHRPLAARYVDITR